MPNWEQVFSQIVVVSNDACRTVYVSGQVSVDKEKKLIGADDFRTQADQTFRNLLTALQAAVATESDVVKLNIYVKDYKPDHPVLISEALHKHFSQKNLPTSTWLGVQSLAEDGFLIEVDAIAVVED